MKSVREIHEIFNSKKENLNGIVIPFRGLEGVDVYNPSIPFKLDNKTIIAGRVEARDSEISKVMFFEQINDEYHLIKDAPIFENLQDPFVSFINGQIILGGTAIIVENNEIVGYHCAFYRGASIYNLEHFLNGPDRMKDVRMVQLKDGKIGVFSRPQGQHIIDKYGCIAKIGFTIVDKLSDITKEIIENAEFLDDVFNSDEWGGANQAYQLEDGTIGVVGHGACGDMIDGINYIHYYSMSFVLDPETRKITDRKIILDRSCFNTEETKLPRLKDVTFTAGLIFNKDKSATIYTGLSDCAIGCCNIKNPFVN